jgi:hypothetical protein
MFAKLFGTDDDQVLVTIDQGDEGPEVRIHCKPTGLGVCVTTLGYPEKAYAGGTNEAWTKAEKCFAEMDEARATQIANGLREQVKELAP